MPTSTFFNNFGNSMEQELLEDLVVESIKIYGQDMYYLPRRRNNFDGVYYEDDISSFDTFYTIEMYIRSTEGFGGQGSFFSKFGLEIRDQVIFSVARRTFEVEITREEAELLRPREGDLIFFPLNKKCFEIKYVDNKPFFYQLGELQMYDLTCELYEYSNETLNTGIEDIDKLQKNFSMNAIDFGILTETNKVLKTNNGDYLVTSKFQDTIDSFDPLADNKRIGDEITDDSVIDWSESNPFADSTRY